MLPIKGAIRRIRLFKKKIKVNFQLRFSKKLKVILGAGNTCMAGWISTDRSDLDITKQDDWEKRIKPDTIHNLFAEHVLEHLSDNDLQNAIKNAFTYLKPGAVFRIAVPDGNRNDDAYVTEVKPPADGHCQYFTIATLSERLKSAGFKVLPLEYYDEKGMLHSEDWNPEAGCVLRSKKNDKQIKFKKDNHFYTSIIVDAIKPE